MLTLEVQETGPTRTSLLRVNGEKIRGGKTKRGGSIAKLWGHYRRQWRKRGVEQRQSEELANEHSTTIARVVKEEQGTQKKNEG